MQFRLFTDLGYGPLAEINPAWAGAAIFVLEMRLDFHERPCMTLQRLDAAMERRRHYDQFVMRAMQWPFSEAKPEQEQQ
jgi:hypothetical protein